MKTRTIEDTGLIPSVVASCVIDELSNYLATAYDEVEANKIRTNSKKFLDKLVTQAEECFKVNRDFKNKISKGNSGRDYLYMYFRHWLSAEVKAHDMFVFCCIPNEFINGQKV